MLLYGPKPVPRPAPSWPPRPTRIGPKAAVLCDVGWRRGTSGEGRVRRFGSVESAVRFAGRVPCDHPACAGVHLLVVPNGRVRDEIERCDDTRAWHPWRTVFTVAIVDARPRPDSIEAELAQCYPPRRRWSGREWLPLHPPAPPPECWPSPGWANPPLEPHEADPAAQLAEKFMLAYSDR